MTSAIMHFPNLETLTALALFHYFLLFCRIGSALMLMPGIGEGFVPPTVRLLLALFITLVVFLPLRELLPPQPENLARLAGLVVGEIATGLFIGSMARLLMGIMHIAGTLIALQSGLASATLFDPNSGSQGAVLGVFLNMLALVLVFATNTHHLILLGLIDSYHTFTAGAFPPVDDFSDFAARLLSDSFRIGFMIASPVMVIGLFMYVAAGVMSRLMPGMQIFFVMMPVQILVSFIIVMFTLSTGMIWYMGYFKDALARLFSVG